MGGDDLDERLLRALGDELLRLSGRRTTTYAGSELESSAFRILWVLDEGGPRTLAGLAEELQLERSTVTRQVHAALEHGHVERVAAAGSAARLVRPTEQGRRAYRHDGQLRRRYYAQALDELGAERAAAMVESLRVFNDALDRTFDEDAGATR